MVEEEKLKLCLEPYFLGFHELLGMFLVRCVVSRRGNNCSQPLPFVFTPWRRVRHQRPNALSVKHAL